MQTAFLLKEAEESFPKLGIRAGEPELDFPQANAWKEQVVKQMTGGVASLFKANGVEWVRGTGRFKDANTIAVEGGEDVVFRSAIIATGSSPIFPPIEGIDSELCVDSTGLLAQSEVPRRIAILGGGVIGCEFASILHRFGSEVTVVEMLPRLLPMEDEDASKELAKQFGKRGIQLHLGKQCTKVEERDGQLTVHFGEGETVEADLMLVVGRPLPERRRDRLDEIGVQYDRRQGDRSRRAQAHVGTARVRGRRRRRLLAARAHRLPRGRGCGRKRARPRRGRRYSLACRGRSTRTRRSPASG